MSVIAFSGWGQKHDSLDAVIDNAQHVDYSAFSNIEALYDHLQETYENVDTVVGWSLGGQIAIRCIAERVLEPKKLILISTPFQFISNPHIRCGKTKHEFANIVSQFEENPAGMLQGFFNYVALNDSRLKEVVKKLQYTPENPEKWKYWLEELGRFSCQQINFNTFPKTLIIHGQQDAVIDVSQSSLLVPLLQDYQLELINDCAHAPHLHNSEYVRALINDM